MIIEDAPIDEWLSVLKPYQSKTLLTIINSEGNEEAAKTWLSANGPSSTARFGGAANPEPFFDRFMVEFRKFVCGDEAYADAREKLGAESPVAKAIYVSVISSALGATLGYTATLLAPPVAILLHTVGTMGVNAWCAAD